MRHVITCPRCILGFFPYAIAFEAENRYENKRKPNLILFTFLYKPAIIMFILLYASYPLDYRELHSSHVGKLTLSQTTIFRLFQTERVCRRQFLT